MIEKFEDVTAELTADEKKRVFDVLSVLRKHRKGSEIKSGAVMSLCWFRFGFDISSATLRKIVSYARRNGLEAICSSSKGYYVATDRKEIESQVRSLRQRASAISAAADGLEKALPPTILTETPPRSLKDFIADVWPTKADACQHVEAVLADRDIEAERKVLAEKITATLERLAENVGQGLIKLGEVVSVEADLFDSAMYAGAALGAARRSDLSPLRGAAAGVYYTPPAVLESLSETVVDFEQNAGYLATITEELKL